MEILEERCWRWSCQKTGKTSPGVGQENSWPNSGVDRGQGKMEEDEPL